jgi:hypothetical protein
MKLNLGMENKPIPISVITVLVLCISAIRSQHSSRLSRMETHGLKKKTLSKYRCCIRIEVTATRQTFSYAHEDHSNTYKTIPGSRQYSQNHSCYKPTNTTLRIASIPIAVLHMVHMAWCTVGLSSKSRFCNSYFKPLILTILFHFHDTIRRIIKTWQHSKNVKLFYLPKL